MLLTLITFIPLLTAIALIFVPAEQKKLIKWLSLAAASVVFVLCCHLWCSYSNDEAPGAVSEKFQTAIEDDLKGVEDTAKRTGMQAALEIAGEDNDRDRDELVVADRSPEGYAEQAGLDLSSLSAEEKNTYRDCWELKLAQGAASSEHIKYVEFGDWIPAFNIRYFMGVDGLSLPLVWLTGLLSVICLAYSFSVNKGTKAYFILFLLLETGLMGVFLALDFFLFYVFWEIVLLPMYFLIGVWGGPRRIYAAIKFFIYTLVGSVLMLVCMIAMYMHSGFDTFNVLTLLEAAPTFGETFQFWLFLGLFVGFAIKVPVFPFHTWLPDAHVQAPTAASVILAGVLLKMGGYGFFRFSIGLAPDAASGQIPVPIFGNFVMFLAILGLINIVYGALCAMAQTDFKSMVAYSSVSHMGYVLLGMAALTDTGLQGAALQMFNHGLSSAMMFLIVGVIYDRAHHRDLNRFGGIGPVMPYYSGMAVIGFFASLGLPGLNGFISEAFVFLGAFQSHGAHEGTNIVGLPAWIVYMSLPGIVLTAAYILWTVQRVYMGPLRNEEYKKFPDVSFREAFALVPLGILCIVLGVWPSLILNVMDDSLSTILNTVLAVGGN